LCCCSSRICLCRDIDVIDIGVARDAALEGPEGDGDDIVLIHAETAGAL
jgi:hypothetical protein